MDRDIELAVKAMVEHYKAGGFESVFVPRKEPKMEEFFDLSDLRFLNADWKTPQTVAGLVYLGKKYDEPIGQWSVTFKKRIGLSYGEIARSQTERKSEMATEERTWITHERLGKDRVHACVDTQKPCRGLYRVYAVNPKTEEILLDGVLIVAGNADEAKFDTLNAIDYKGKLGSLDVRVECVMGLRAKKEVQEVKIVKEE